MKQPADSWGTSIYYFKIGEQLREVRQMQVFKNGQVLKYSIDFPFDEFGMLSDRPFDQTEFQEFVMNDSEFKTAWNTLEMSNPGRRVLSFSDHTFPRSA